MNSFKSMKTHNDTYQRETRHSPAVFPPLCIWIFSLYKGSSFALQFASSFHGFLKFLDCCFPKYFLSSIVLVIP